MIDGKIDPALGRTIPFAAIPAAHAAVGRGEEVFGNVAALVGAREPGRRRGMIVDVDYETIAVGIAGRVATISLRCPEALNALNLRMMRELVEAAHRLDDDHAISVLILEGPARAFAAGADIKEMPTNAGARCRSPTSPSTTARSPPRRS